MKKKGTMPDWLIALILALAIFAVVLLFILGSYREGVSNFVADNILKPLSGGP
jgi:F0F1-type ATP synthase membrane subunit a